MYLDHLHNVIIEIVGFRSIVQIFVFCLLPLVFTFLFLFSAFFWIVSVFLVLHFNLSVGFLTISFYTGFSVVAGGIAIYILNTSFST